jgi:hypothetical protein
VRVVLRQGQELHLRLGAGSESFLTEVITYTAGTSAEGLTPAAVESWLGVAPGGSFRWGGPRPAQVVGSVLGLIPLTGLSVWLIAKILETPHLFLGNYGQSVCLAVIGTVALVSNLWSWWRSDRVTADGQGLTARRGRRRRVCAWSEITGLEKISSGWRVDTEDGPLLLSNDVALGRLVGVIRRILVLRQAGRGLPSEEPVSDTALSRATGEAEADERGISLAEGRDA